MMTAAEAADLEAPPGIPEACRTQEAETPLASKAPMARQALRDGTPSMAEAAAVRHIALRRLLPAEVRSTAQAAAAQQAELMPVLRHAQAAQAAMFNRILRVVAAQEVPHRLRELRDQRMHQALAATEAKAEAAAVHLRAQPPEAQAAQAGRRAEAVAAEAHHKTRLIPAQAAQAGEEW